MKPKLVTIYSKEDVDVAEKFLADARDDLVDDYVIAWRRKTEHKDHGDGLTSNNEVIWQFHQSDKGLFNLLGMVAYLKDRIIKAIG